ncbi:hypothetical protein K488DRAFT_92832 [Vararia minispora EC-137]|uniref:Uncharacterized protein n=1 Tax=Vararia minispora EC-137 TaxID=1314806 RepID=A0ACB8Q3Q3_9AGAM|nr:hypothetical protein K488DRAFT_92832 [Vararia minispora EC-137]
MYKIYNAATKRVRFAWERFPAHSPFLCLQATFVGSLTLNSRRITPVIESRSKDLRAQSAIVKIFVDGVAHVAEVLRLFYHRQPGIEDSGDRLFAEVRWLVRAGTASLQTAPSPWAAFPELDVNLWAYGVYAPTNAPDTPPCVVPARAIRCQLARGALRTTQGHYWVTTSFERVRNDFILHADLETSPGRGHDGDQHTSFGETLVASVLARGTRDAAGPARIAMVLDDGEQDIFFSVLLSVRVALIFIVSFFAIIQHRKALHDFPPSGGIGAPVPVAQDEFHILVVLVCTVEGLINLPVIRSYQGKTL